jgi:hypothetical protein
MTAFHDFLFSHVANDEQLEHRFTMIAGRVMDASAGDRKLTMMEMDMNNDMKRDFLKFAEKKDVKIENDLISSLILRLEPATCKGNTRSTRSRMPG